MKGRQSKRKIMAWVLLMVFSVALGLKSVHFHSSGTCSTEQTDNGGQTMLKGTCSVCAFQMHPSEEPTLVVYSLVLPIVIVRYFLPSVKFVYHKVDAINTHSPPFCA